MAERAHPGDPQWGRRFLLFPTPALKYLKKRYRLCRPYVSGRRVLDVPCGNGMGFPLLRDAEYVVGVDFSVEAANFAVSHFGGRVGAADMTRLPFRAGSFETVVCLEGIEHVDRSSGLKLLSEAARVIQPGGWFVLSCPVLRRDRLHSGNEFHFYEWQGEELLEAVDSLFKVSEKKSIRGPGGNVLIVFCRRGDKTAVFENGSRSTQKARYESAVERAIGWIDRSWVGAQARYWQGGSATLLATTFAVLASETLGVVRGWSRDRVKEVTSEILDQQDKDTGFFGASLVKEEDLVEGSTCDGEYVVQQITYFCLSALVSLGSEPRYPLKFAHRFLDLTSLRDFIDQGPWDDVWNQSNRVMFVLRYLIHLMDDADCAAAARIAFDDVLDDLDVRQDRETGLWFGDGPMDHRRGVFAAYHFLPFYLWRGRRPAHVDAMIDSVLGIQRPEGLFGASNGGGACEDLDAIDLLVNLTRLSDHRAADIRVSLQRAFDRILQLQREDGGFPNYLAREVELGWKRRLAIRLGLGEALERRRPIPRQESRYSGWSVVSTPLGESDQWGTWFRTLALNLIAGLSSELGSPPGGLRFHALPALGWHDPAVLERIRLEEHGNGRV